MTPGMPLAKPHLLSDYLKTSRQDDSDDSDIEVEGVVYVETDVRYSTPTGEVAAWAKGPLDEIKFLRSIIEGENGARDGKLLIGLVPWAPMDQPLSTFQEYLRLAEETAGESTWARIKGFRYLLQFRVDQEQFRNLVLGDRFITNLIELGRKGFAFDIGVDQRSGGLWQLEIVAQAMHMVQKQVSDNEQPIFIINHLCKPDFSEQGAQFERWCNAIETMSSVPRTYMKLSGAFSELPPGLTKSSDIATHMKPWVAHVLKCFGPRRIMFGSDWPVCNVKGPLKEHSWIAWKAVVDLLLDDQAYGLSVAEKDWIWRGTAREAYRLN